MTKHDMKILWEHIVGHFGYRSHVNSNVLLPSMLYCLFSFQLNHSFVRLNSF